MPKVTKVGTHGALECWSIGVMEEWGEPEIRAAEPQKSGGREKQLPFSV